MDGVSNKIVYGMLVIFARRRIEMRSGESAYMQHSGWYDHLKTMTIIMTDRIYKSMVHVIGVRKRRIQMKFVDRKKKRRYRKLREMKSKMHVGYM